MERGCGEAASRAIECGDRDTAEDVAIAAALTDQLALAQHHNDASKIRVAAHRQRASHNQESRAAQERAIAVNKCELAAIDRIGDGLRTTEITTKRLCFVLQTAEIRARFVG